MASFALISGGLDGLVKLWDPRTRALIRQLYKHNSSVCSFSVQANVFYSCAVDNIIKVWDWKDGTCLGTMHGHRETVANLCLTPEGTLFSSGIDKMVKVWKPPGSWGEEWHGLRELDLTTAGMVAEDVDRLEKQLRGEAAKWVSLSVSNNYLYDEGIGKLVQVLQKTTAPLETLDLSRTGMTSVGARMVAQLLAPLGGATQLPLKKLVLHGNAIGADGYGAVGAAIRHPKCGLVELGVDADARAQDGAEPRVALGGAQLRPRGRRQGDERAQDGLCRRRGDDAPLRGPPLNTSLPRSTSRRTSSATTASTRSRARSPRGRCRSSSSRSRPTSSRRKAPPSSCAACARATARSWSSASPTTSITLCGAAVRRRRDAQEKEAELKKAASGSRNTPGSEWAKAQLHVRQAVRRRASSGSR